MEVGGFALPSDEDEQAEADLDCDSLSMVRKELRRGFGAMGFGIVDGSEHTHDMVTAEVEAWAGLVGKVTLEQVRDRDLAEAWSSHRPRFIGISRRDSIGTGSQRQVEQPPHVTEALHLNSGSASPLHRIQDSGVVCASRPHCFMSSVIASLSLVYHRS